jgi:hypothetical protein
MVGVLRVLGTLLFLVGVGAGLLINIASSESIVGWVSIAAGFFGGATFYAMARGLELLEMIHFKLREANDRAKG